MSSCKLEVHFDQPDRTYRPGDQVRGEVVVVTDKDVTSKGLAVELLWQTHGKGNTDRKVLEKLDLETQQWSAGLPYHYPFAFTAPSSPLTYHGNFLNIDNYVAARADLPWAIDAKVSEEYLLAPGPSSHADYLAAPPDFTIAPAAKAGPVATVIGWILLPIILVLLVGLLAMALPLVAIIGGAMWLKRRAAEGRVGRVTVEVDAPELKPPSSGGASAAVAKISSRWQTPSPRVVTPGGKVRFSVGFRPKTQVDLDRVSVNLVGTEECRSGSGTNARTYTHTVCEEKLALAEGLTCLPGNPVELSGEVQVPDLAAYSFRAPDNAVKWKLAVRLEVPRWPDWTGDTALALIPAEMTASPEK